MKLRNKKTGEIIEFDAILPVKDVAGDSVAHLEYGSLTELNEEWEDYEEPKEYWFLSGRGEVRCIEDDGVKFDTDHKEIGNYFETREEAEKAVEKLKAWKRLKDNGLLIKKWSHTPDMHLTTGSFLKIEGFIPAIMKNIEDLDLLFGGEE